MTIDEAITIVLEQRNCAAATETTTAIAVDLWRMIGQLSEAMVVRRGLELRGVMSQRRSRRLLWSQVATGRTDTCSSHRQFTWARPSRRRGQKSEMERSIKRRCLVARANMARRADSARKAHQGLSIRALRQPLKSLTRSLKATGSKVATLNLVSHKLILIV